MYAGPFNQNIWLRSFIRDDLVDEYERKCRDIVNDFKGKPTTRFNLKIMSMRMHKEMDALFNKCVDLKEECRGGAPDEP